MSRPLMDFRGILALVIAVPVIIVLTKRAWDGDVQATDFLIFAAGAVIGWYFYQRGKKKQ